jgi:tetratricopeptide (TPR) repeat protein/tRNA A-37 threonylcarbamoyl transferase component Bud32
MALSLPHMASDEGGPPPRKRAVTGVGAIPDDAFAATVAPTSAESLAARATPVPPASPGYAGARSTADAVRRPIDLPVGTGVPSRMPGLDSQLTHDVPLDGVLPPLPLVSDEHYKKEQGEIARGGMGRIVAAEDQRLHRQVALKELLEPAGEQLTRFQREALITARLQHPGIVPVYEAGRWPSGEPFFAMKLVEGDPLDKVISKLHTLPERLALLPRIAAAADAIAYAHSKKIVHRDLKPGNILLGAYGETVVIDWGLAKDLDAVDTIEGTRIVTMKKTVAERPASKKTDSKQTSSTLTVAGAVMGTPAYMAPEQARGEPVDERADVFALGAMLYHLLAGVPPYNAKTATDVIAAAALGRVVPLAEREEGAPDDLVAIVQRAMAPLPVDRYPHAGELADELRRFLTGQLVSAHRYTNFQRFARFVKKHRAAVTIAAISAIALIVGGTLAVANVARARDRAEQQAAIADARRQAAEKLIDKMLDDMKERLLAIGRIDLLSNLGAEVRNYYDTLAKIPGGMPLSDVDRMAIAIELVGRAERDSGQSDRALKTWGDGRKLLEEAVAAEKASATLFKRAMIARLDYQIGTVQQTRGKSAAAIAQYVKAKDGFSALRAEAPNDRFVLRWAADNHDKLGDLLRNDGKIDQAYEEYTAAKLDRERASGQTSSRPSEEVRALSTSHLKVGSIHHVRGESTSALASYRKALNLRETVLENQPDHMEVQEEVLEVQDAIAELQRQTGDAKSAVETYQRALPIMNALVQRDPSNVLWKRRRGGLFADLGFALLDSGDFKGGLAQLDAAAEAQQELLARDPKNSTFSMDLSRSFMRAGDGHLYLGAFDKGIALYEQSLAIRKTLSERDPKSAPYRRATAWSLHKLANAYALKGELPKAIETHEKVLALRAQLVDESPTQSGFKNELASTEIALGKALAKSDAKRGKELIHDGLERARSLVGADNVSNEWKETLTQGLLAHADCQRVANDAKGRKSSLDEAIGIAMAGSQRAPQNPQWQGFLAEIHAGYAELAGAIGDRAATLAAWKTVRDLLEPLDKAGRLPAVRKNLLERARAAK